MLMYDSDTLCVPNQTGVAIPSQTDAKLCPYKYVKKRLKHFSVS